MTDDLIAAYSASPQSKVERKQRALAAQYQPDALMDALDAQALAGEPITPDQRISLGHYKAAKAAAEEGEGTS